jgi:SAM-dependent methyltransferase|tara:strand:- start:175 stop:1185 length:1011 start_codon:yes stop_codon:yes gene_type:complete
MKLIDLVKYRNTLTRIVSSNQDLVDYQNIERPIFQELERFNATVNLATVDIANIKQSMHNKQQDILKNLNELYIDLNRFILELEKMIANIEQDYYKKSIIISNNNLNKPWEQKLHDFNYGELFIAPPYLKKPRQSIPQKTFVGAIRKHLSFQWPGLEIGPAAGMLTEHLVALDPLYIADNRADAFTEVKKLWKQDYQRRLRYYVLDDSEDNPLHEFPKEQLGFILSFDWFNFKQQNIIERYVKHAFDILRPGGAMLFTYNNCNYPKAIDKVDKMHYTYTNGNTLKQFCESIGFEIASSYDGEKEINWCVSWLELQKPGIRTSLRGGQNLGAINRLQ